MRARGFNKLLQRENSGWWRGQRWQIQTLLGVGGICGFVAFVLFIVPQVAATQGESIDALAAGEQIFFGLGSFVIATAVIILTQDAVIGEKQSGIAEWVLSKPVSRKAYILSKLVAHTIGVGTTLVALPALVGYVLFSLKEGAFYPVQPYLTGIGMLVIHTLFFITSSIFMGVAADKRSTLLGATLGFLLLGLILPDFIGRVVMVTPWALPNLAVAVVAGGPIPSPTWLPAAVTLLLSLVAVLGALRIFNHVDL
jgi:ABC-2 type transport system permease protein